MKCKKDHTWNTSRLVDIQNGHRCPECNNCKRLTLDKYISVCQNKGKFLDKQIPKNNKQICNWLCFLCNKKYKASYHDVDSGRWCNCKRFRTLEEYRNICKKHSKYILNYIPKRTDEKIKGWLCNICNNIYNNSYTNIG